MAETAAQKAMRLMREVDSNPRTSYPKGDVKTILNNIAHSADDDTAVDASSDGCRAPASLESVKRGDVFIAKMVGGKVRPWIALRVNGDRVTAVAMSSSDSAPGMMPGKCRLWPGCWVGSTLSVFEMETACKEVTRPYTNAAHLREIEEHIVALHGLLPRPHARRQKQNVRQLHQVAK